MRYGNGSANLIKGHPTNEKTKNNMKITNAIVWDHRGRVPENGTGQVEIRITLKRKSYHFGTGIKCHKSELVAGRIVNCPGADELNKRIGIIYAKVLAMVNACLDAGVPINTKDIREKVWQVVESQSDQPTLINWIEKQIPLLNIKEGTKKHYYPLVARLTEFGKMTRWQDVTVENICNFDSYLHTLTKPISDAKLKAGIKAEKLSDAGVYNYHKTLKHMLRRAEKFGKIDRNPYELLRGQFKRGEKENYEFLTEEEVARFEALELPVGSILDIAKDLFIFQLYTGLAYSDCQAFDIKRYKWDGERWCHIGERIKTGEPYVSVLLPPVVKMLKKYGMKIPKMSNADYNRHLKSLAIMAGINTRMHTHLARHTFATNVVNNDIKIENLQKMLGHKNIRQTQRYAKVQPKSVMKDFDMIAAKMAVPEQENKI